MFHSLADMGFPNHSINKEGQVYTHNLNRLLNIYEQNGYKAVMISENFFYIHRLLMMVFNPVDGMESLTVNHIDGDKFNNSLENLEWVARAENTYHYFTEKAQIGDEEEVHKICKLMENGLKDREIAEVLGCSQGRVSAIRGGRAYYRISKNYNLPPVKSRKRKGGYTEDQIREVCVPLRDTELNYHRIGKIAGVSQSTVSTIERRRGHLRISKDYEWEHREVEPVKYRGY